MFFRRLISALGGASGSRRPQGKKDARAYVVGDVHGRLDLLDDLLSRIEADVAARPQKPSYLVFLGDLIDRGPDSSGVLNRLLNYRHDMLKPVFLTGNHEEFFLKTLNGEAGALDRWLAYGGKECVESYGLDAERLGALPEGEGVALLRSKVPNLHRRFLESMSDTFRFGDYLFVHAGIRPGVDLEHQTRNDLRWIRDAFLGSTADHGFVVVHGHTIVNEVEERSNRIAIDTGAYRTGILTGLLIEGEERTLFSAQAIAGALKRGRPASGLHSPEI